MVMVTNNDNKNNKNQRVRAVDETELLFNINYTMELKIFVR